MSSRVAKMESFLKLTMLKGPRMGETIEFRTASKIRIGRIFRGNELSIKDSGISSKHLSIEFDSGKWRIQDLDSSNGTIVNSSSLCPFTPFDLHDGDVIKLGEYTSMIIEIEKSALARPNPNKTSVTRSNVEVREQMNARVTRSRTNKCTVVSEKDVAERGSEMKNEGRNQIRGNKRKNVWKVTSENVKIHEANVTSGLKLGSKGTKERIENVISGNEKDCEVIDGEENGNAKSASEKNGKGRVVLQKVPLGERFHVEDGTLEVKLGMKLESKRKENGLEDVVCGHKESECMVMEDEQNKHGELDSEEKGKGRVDLNKMSLGEWFDFMKGYLPRQIVDVTDDIIEEMKCKAEQVEAYMMEMKQHKGAIVVG